MKKDSSKPFSKRDVELFKTMLTNEYRFYRTIAKHSNFFLFLAFLHKRYFPRRSRGFPDIRLGPIKRFQDREDITEKSLHAVYRWKESREDEFLGHIDTLLRIYNLGKEWRATLIAYALKGILCPPVYNLHVDQERVPMFSQKNKDADKRFRRLGIRTILILNPDTSFKDIQDAWPEVKKLQERSWLKFKSANITTETKKQFRDLIKVNAAKKKISDKERIKELSFFEEQLFLRKHRGNEGAAKKAIAEYRKKQGIRKSVKIKNKRTDEEAIKKVFNLKDAREIEREIGRIRKIRERLLGNDSFY